MTEPLCMTFCWYVDYVLGMGLGEPRKHRHAPELEYVDD